MSVSFIAVLACDLPAVDQYLSKCGARFRFPGTAADVRREAREQEKWRRAGGFDFCGEHGKLVYRKHSPRSVEQYPQPAESWKLDVYSHEFTKAHARWRPGCSCGWAATADTLHFRLVDELCSEGGVNDVWLETHVRIDVFGLPPMWTREQLDRVQLRDAQFMAERKAARDRRRATDRAAEAAGDLP